MSLFKIIGIIVLVYVMHATYSYYKTTKETVEDTMIIAPMLNDVSENWDLSAVQNHIGVIEFDKNISFYKSMLSNLSYLGGFDNCSNLRIIDTSSTPSLDKKIMQGNCTFANGSANLTAIFSYDNEVAKLFHFVISGKVHNRVDEDV